MAKESYLPVAQEHERVFKNILKDIQDNRGTNRLASMCLTEDIDLEQPVAELYRKYTGEAQQGLFNILSFEVKGKKATMHVCNMVPLAGI